MKNRAKVENGGFRFVSAPVGRMTAIIVVVVVGFAFRRRRLFPGQSSLVELGSEGEIVSANEVFELGRKSLSRVGERLVGGIYEEGCPRIVSSSFEDFDFADFLNCERFELAHIRALQQVSMEATHQLIAAPAETSYSTYRVRNRI